jgi:hypothetical protein
MEDASYNLCLGCCLGFGVVYDGQRQVCGQMILVPKDPCPWWNIKLKLLNVFDASTASGAIDYRCEVIIYFHSPSNIVKSQTQLLET